MKCEYEIRKGDGRYYLCIYEESRMVWAQEYINDFEPNGLGILNTGDLIEDVDALLDDPRWYRSADNLLESMVSEFGETVEHWAGEVTSYSDDGKCRHAFWI